MSKREHRPPKLIIGPGFVLAAILAVVVYLHDRPNRGLELERPTVEQAQPLHVDTPELGLTPEPAWLVHHATEVRLTAEQQATIGRIDAAYRDATAGERVDATAAAADLEASLAAQQRSGGLNRDATGSEAASFSEHSANLAARRQAAWADAWSELTEPQRDQVRQLRREKPLELR